MSTNESWRRFLDAGTAVGAATLSRATEIAKGLMDDEPETRERAWRDLDDMGRTGRQLGEQLADLAKSRLRGPIGHVGSIEETLDWISDLVSVRTGRDQSHPEGSDAADRLGGHVEAQRSTGASSKDKKYKKKDEDGKTKHKKGAASKHKKQKQAGRETARPDRVLTLSRPADPAGRR